MRDALRWVCAVVTYTLVLCVVLLAIVIAMGDPVAGREGGFPFGNPSLGVAALLMVVIGVHSLACASAVSIAPAHRRIVGLVAVVLPVGAGVADHSPLAAACRGSPCAGLVAAGAIQDRSRLCP